MNDPSAILDLALRIFTGRLTLLLALGMAFGLFCWAMWMGTTLSLVVAGTFTTLVFLPVLIKESSSGVQAN